MRTSIATVLTSILLLSDKALAQWKRAIPLKEYAPEITSKPVTSSQASASEADGVYTGPLNNAVQTPIEVISTVLVVPLPETTPSGIHYPGLLTGTGSGYAHPTGHHHRNGTHNITCGYAHPSGHHHINGTGTYICSGYALPTGHHHKNGTRTHAASGSSTATAGGILFNATSSIPFFTLQTTGSLALPSFVTPLVPVTTSSLAAPTAPIPIPTTPTSTLTTSIIPPPPSSAPPASSSTAPQQSAAPPPAPSSAPSTSSSTAIPFLRGVNLGGWLVLEQWMDGDLFSGAFASAVDQYTFDQIPGAQAALEQHWQTFFVESDISDLAATGINALRIPIGFWAYDNAGTPYISGADAYLEKAIGWARNCGMKVWVDCHGSPGSQNGFDNSGQKGLNEWQQDDNLARSISVLKIMAAKYGAQEYADVVVGLELTNEPISYGNNNFETTKSWAQEAYTAVKAVVANDNLVIVMHDAFQTPLAWMNVADTLLSDLVSGAPRSFGVDTHLYGLYTDTEDGMTQDQHIAEACGWGQNLKTANDLMPTYVGEWSAATNVCVNPDGSTTGGTSCSVAGCQCQSADFDEWNDGMIEVVRKYVEAQMDAFEKSSSGYFMWAAKGPGGWGFLNGIKNGVVPNPVTSRKYGSQCGGNGRREVRGSLGLHGETW